MRHTWPEEGGDLGNSIKGIPEQTDGERMKDDDLEDRHAIDRDESHGERSLESITLVEQLFIE